MASSPDRALSQVQNAASKPKAPAPISLYDLRYAAAWFEDPQKRAAAWDETHAVSTLQGIVNRRAPRLYLRAIVNPEGGSIPVDDWWLEKLQSPGAWLEKRPVETIPDLESLLRQFRRDVKGLVVYDGNVPATSNVASTVAGVEDSIAVRYDAAPDSLFQRLQKMGFPVKTWLINRDGTPLFTGRGTIPGTREPSSGSAKNDAYIWAMRKFLETGRASSETLAYYVDSFPLFASTRPGAYKLDLWKCTLTNHDYFVSKRAFFCDLGFWGDEPATDDPTQPSGLDLKTMRRILRTMAEKNGGKKMIHAAGMTPWATKYTNLVGGKHEAVPTEWETVRVLSQYNAYLDADALGLSGMANASFFTHQKLPKYPKEKPIDLQKHLAPDGSVLPKKYVAFYVGDYDAAAWMYQMLPMIWGDKARGQTPLGWAMNPNLAMRFPAGFWYTRETRSPNDSFTAGDSGAGYVNPSQLEEGRQSGLPPANALWEAHNKSWYDKFGIGITGFVIDGATPAMSPPMLDAYARFSPLGVISQNTSWQLRGQTPFLRMNGAYPQGSPQETADFIRTQFTEAAPSFQIFRSVLKSPSWYREVAQKLEAGAGEIVIVEPYTLMELAKRQMQKK